MVGRYVKIGAACAVIGLGAAGSFFGMLNKSDSAQQSQFVDKEVQSGPYSGSFGNFAVSYSNRQDRVSDQETRYFGVSVRGDGFALSIATVDIKRSNMMKGRPDVVLSGVEFSFGDSGSTKIGHVKLSQVNAAKFLESFSMNGLDISKLMDSMQLGAVQASDIHVSFEGRRYSASKLAAQNVVDGKADSVSFSNAESVSRDGSEIFTAESVMSRNVDLPNALRSWKAGTYMWIKEIVGDSDFRRASFRSPKGVGSVQELSSKLDFDGKGKVKRATLELTSAKSETLFSYLSSLGADFHKIGYQNPAFSVSSTVDFNDETRTMSVSPLNIFLNGAMTISSWTDFQDMPDQETLFSRLYDSPYEAIRNSKLSSFTMSVAAEDLFEKINSYMLSKYNISESDATLYYYDWIELNAHLFGTNDFSRRLRNQMATFLRFDKKASFAMRPGREETIDSLVADFLSDPGFFLQNAAIKFSTDQ